MNSDFFPNNLEQLLIDKIQELNTNDYALIRMTKTMLDKSIVDASLQIRLILEEQELFHMLKFKRGKK